MLPPLEGRRLLVVGGAGFVGSRLVRRLLEGEPASVLVIDNLLSSERENLPDDPRIELREASIADDSVISSLPTRLDFVFHLATYHGNQSSLANPLEDHDNNLITTLKLYERLTQLDHVGRVVYSSTGCALAEKSTTDAREVVEDEPISLDFDTPYQISKVVGEMYSVFYARAHSLPVVRARFQNVYGPGEVLGAGRWRGTPATVWRNVTPTFVYRAIKGLPLEIHGDGTSSRDFIYVDDIVEGLLHCAGTAGIEGDVFNLASGVETAIGDLARSVVRLVGGDASVEFIPQRGWDRSLARLGSTKKSREILGFERRVSLEQGLAQTIDWTREHLPYIERCIAKHSATHPVGI
jgi:nucleoside-diphosphate-sugar epimerase